MSKATKVLVVEDEPIVRIDIVDHLEDAGFEVVEASNAAEALAALECHDAIQLIFTDIDMPGTMDGLMLAAAVSDRWPPVRIIVTSGHRTVEITDIPDGSVFFSKHYQAKSVIASMHELLRR